MKQEGQCTADTEQDLKLERMIGFQLRCAQLTVFRDILAAFDGTPVTIPQFSALMVICDNPGVSQAELAATIEVDRPRIVPLLDVLEERGWTFREPSTRDRRVRRLYLTDVGRAILDELKPRFAMHQRRMEERLGDIELSLLLEALQRLSGQRGADK